MSTAHLKSPHHKDVIIIGAGAAGLFCAGQAGALGQKVMVIDHRQKPAEKIRISGGGRCNFTNIYSDHDNFLSRNPHFAKSALAGYSPYDFIDLVSRYNIAFHEKKDGQLFCDNSAQDIIDMLIDECHRHQVSLCFNTNIDAVTKQETGYLITTDQGHFTSDKLVIATGGLSIPKIGATGFGYDIARQFNLPIIKPRAGLVPLTFTDKLKQSCQDLSGLSVPARISFEATHFAEGLLFTHRGLSGPSILQISSYWQEGHDLHINLMPNVDVSDFLKIQKQKHPRQDLQTILGKIVPKRLAATLCNLSQIDGRLADLADKRLEQVANFVKDWQVRPSGTEGYRTAEVTLGGVDTNSLSSKTMEVKSCKGLYFIGEVVDVTGHLGGHNFQWAWASGYAAAQSF